MAYRGGARLAAPRSAPVEEMAQLTLGATGDEGGATGGLGGATGGEGRPSDLSLAQVANQGRLRTGQAKMGKNKWETDKNTWIKAS